ncbi:putative glucose-6-phosphate 1-epimerase [Physcomitrium patens]|nr:putative glucose-6-phosphate 1-epimerase isoform X1 [Physcomitrium patens]PNR51746.1 hypothetical protein PHYPA_010934 [Physcomitrium patens]|eukprot:XP_024380720.1 putative glucose-6-phosphate 1-epimerase isoform X1 [Physcomitrella patens]
MALLKLSSAICSSAFALGVAPSLPHAASTSSRSLSWKRSSPFHGALPSTVSSPSGLPSSVVAPRASQATGVSAEAENLNEKYGTEGVKVQSGEGGLTKVVLSGRDGSEAEVYLYGGCVTSWKAAGGKDLLFVRPDAVFTGKKPISGGLPHCFPQFGPGVIQQHGFARNVTWDIASTQNDGGSPTLVLGLKPSDYSRSIWNYEFSVTFKIVLGEKKLTTEMVVENTDTKSFSFTTALHSYFRADVSKTSVTGLKGCKRLDKPYEDPANPVEGSEDRNVIEFPGFVDTMYMNTPNVLVLDNGLGEKLSIRNEGWTDAVLWNPYLTMEACYKDFVCVENAQLSPVELQPGQSWTAKQSLSL